MMIVIATTGMKSPMAATPTMSWPKGELSLFVSISTGMMMLKPTVLMSSAKANGCGRSPGSVNETTHQYAKATVMTWFSPPKASGL